MMPRCAPSGAPRADGAIENSPDGSQVRATILDQAVTWPWTTDEKQIADRVSSARRKQRQPNSGSASLDQVVETPAAFSNSF
jgi:hypothetical protein